MPRLYGQTLTRRQMAERTGNLSQFAGVRLVTLGDGAERGIRILEFRTGSGLRFSVAVDRAMDIAEVEHKGRAVGWQSPTGLRHPAFQDDEGEGGLGWTRSFTGFLATCGLDHILGPEVVPADGYGYPHRKTQHQTLHGRIANLPARLTGYGERWESETCILWAEGVVRQATVFGENLALHRRIEAEVGGDVIHLTDRVVNHGFRPTPHMFLYHINIGHPVLDEGARYLAPIADVVWAAHAGEGYRAQGVGYTHVPPPSPGFREQVWQHDMQCDAAGLVPVAVVNDRLAFGIEVTTHKDQFPCAYQWQFFQSGNYVMGIEPATHHVLGDRAARARGEMIWLQAGEARDYAASFRVLDGSAEIAEAEARIRSICGQPENPFPDPSGQFRPLAGRGGPDPLI